MFQRNKKQPSLPNRQQSPARKRRTVKLRPYFDSLEQRVVLTDISGQWSGTATQGYGGSANLYSFDLNLSQSGNNVSGTERVGDRQYYAIIDLTGIVDQSKNIFNFQENSITDQNPPPGYSWLIKSGSLQISADASSMNGPWYPDYGGTISVTKTSSVTPPPPPPLADITLDAASVTGSTVQFSGHTTNNPGTFTVSLYESADANIDATDSLIVTQQETPRANSSFADTFHASFKPNPSKPYLLVVVEPGIYLVNNNAIPAYLVNENQLLQIMPALSITNADRYIAPLNEAMEEFRINNSRRAAAFLGQIAAETLQLNVNWWEEHVSAATGPNYVEYTINATTQAHRNRAVQEGNTNPGDGLKYHGRGPLQLTWKDNYIKASEALFGDDTLVLNPALVSDPYHPSVGFRAAAWYFSTVTRPSTGALTANDYADALEPSDSGSLIPIIDSITFIVNGGYNNRDQRRKFTENALVFLGVT